MNLSLSKLREKVKDREAWCTAIHRSQRVRHNLATEQQQFLVASCGTFVQLMGSLVVAQRFSCFEACGIFFLFLFWLCWILVAVQGLSSVSESGLVLVVASRCGAQALGLQFRFVALGPRGLAQ